MSEEKLSSLAAELAHAEHDERLRFAGRVARLAVHRTRSRVRIVDGGGDGRVREGAGVGQGFGHGRKSREVAPGDAHHLARALAPQRRHEPGQSGSSPRRRFEPLRHFAARERAIERRALDEPRAQRHIALQTASQTKSLAASTRGSASRSGTDADSKGQGLPTRAGLSVAAHRRLRVRASRARDFTRNSACRRRATAYD